MTFLLYEEQNSIVLITFRRDGRQFPNSRYTVYQGGLILDFFLHFEQKYPSDLLHTFQKKHTKKIWSSDRFMIGHYFWSHALYKGPKFVIHNMDFMGIKRCIILRRFQK
jgi:hypothetical protein